MTRRFVTITKNASNPAYKGARSGVDRLAAERNVAVKHYTPEVPDSIPEQIAFLEKLIREKPDAILLAPANISALDNVLDEVKAAGIAVIMFVGCTAKDNYVTFVGSDDYKMTYEVAQAIGEDLGGAGKVGIIDGNPLGINFNDRSKGFRDGIAQFPGVEVVATRIGNFLREPAYEAAMSILSDHPDVNAMLVANDFMSLGVIDALREHGVAAKIGSINATPEGIAAIKAGDMVVTAAFNAMAMGCLALEAAIRHLDGKPTPKKILIPVEMVSRSNLSVWDIPYAKRPLPLWPESA